MGYLSKLIQRLSVVIEWDVARHTITEPSPDGQDDNNYNRGRLVCGSTGSEILTKFKPKEENIGGLKDNPPTPRVDVAPNGSGGGWCVDWSDNISQVRRSSKPENHSLITVWR